MVASKLQALARTAPGGVFCSRELNDIGFGSGSITSMIRRCILHKEVHRWYSLVGAPLDPKACLHLPLRYAEELDSDGFAAVSDEGTLALFGAPGFALPCRPTLLIRRGRRMRVSDAPWDVQHVSEIPRVLRHRGVTTVHPLRAIADHARDPKVSDRVLRNAVDFIRNQLRLTQLDLAGEWATVTHPGGTRMMRMLADGVFDMESDGERDAHAALFQAYPPAPDCQVTVLGSLRADFAYVFSGLVLEYLGKPHDGKADEDATRGHALERAGLKVIYITKSMTRDDPRSFMAWVHGVRRDRERRILEGSLAQPHVPAQHGRLTPLRTLVPLG